MLKKGKKGTHTFFAGNMLYKKGEKGVRPLFRDDGFVRAPCRGYATSGR
jgi:hypothetical protein